MVNYWHAILIATWIRASRAIHFRRVLWTKPWWTHCWTTGWTLSNSSSKTDSTWQSGSLWKNLKISTIRLIDTFLGWLDLIDERCLQHVVAFVERFNGVVGGWFDMATFFRFYASMFIKFVDQCICYFFSSTGFECT